VVQGLPGGGGGAGEEGGKALIAVDTNILVYAFDVRVPLHRRALDLLRGLAEGQRPWGLPWPCITEFLSVVTAADYPRPHTAMEAVGFLDRVMASPALRCLRPTEDTLRVWREVLDDSGVRGLRVHDAHIFALCLEHGVRELLTADRGFRRFRGLKVRDPFR
jgi:toxin-antitoxin system PIN domain toxin